MNGFVVLDKKAGITSFQASGFLRKVYHEKKTGHTGTLDPMATGVLPVAVGRATRFIDFLPHAEKAYTARFRLGEETDTLDVTGTVLRSRPVTAGEAEVRAVLPDLTGEQWQLPPMYSAVSVGGQRLYKLARQGIEVERERRRVTVSRLELTAAAGENEYEIEVVCTPGTYIRSLIADLGEALGCGAVMTALRRTASNGFTLADAAPEEAVAADPARYLLPVDHPFRGLPAVPVTEKQAARFRNGGALFTERLRMEPAPGLYRLYAPDGGFLGLGAVTAEDPDNLTAARVMGL